MILAPALTQTDRYELRLASDSHELETAQRLRYEVFNLELNEGLSGSVVTGLDRDEFDDVCDHLLVVEPESRAVVGTYRLQTGTRAARNLGYYSEREFDFTPFAPARDRIVELGRACIDRHHRNQSVLSLLWRGIALYAQRHGARHLVGCSSLTSQNPAAGLALYRQLASCIAPPEWCTTPLPALRCFAEDGHPVERVDLPRLMGAYLALGARICSEPAIDREFGTIDFLTWLDLEKMPERVRRKFFQ